MNILDKTDEVVFYGAGLTDGEEDSAFASAKALNWGYQNVFYFSGFRNSDDLAEGGGFHGWKEDGYPVETFK